MLKLKIVFFLSIYLPICSFQYIFRNGDSNVIANSLNVTKDNLILWSASNKLTWNDFQGNPDTTSNYKAITTSQIGFTPEIHKDSIILSVPCNFLKSESWSVRKSNYALLAHEQLHFDIAELVARNIRKGCSKHVSTSLNESSIFLQTCYDKF